jgi:uncharacterized OsmC-like protein
VTLLIEGERKIRVLAGHQAGFDIQSTTPEVGFSPLHMLAGSLATCTFAVLAGWAMPAGIAIDDLTIELTWNYVDEPYRVGSYDMTIHWPSLPEHRRTVALRVATHCTVEATLRHPPTIRTITA